MPSFPRFAFRVIDVAFDWLQNHYKFENIHVDQDIVYDEAFPDVCALDIYRHEDKVGVKIPTIINCPGGGYMAGDRKYRKGIASLMVDKLDVCVVNFTYHTCENYRFPQFMRDAMKAIEWVKEHAEEYHFDLDNLYIMGDSAGAQIAAHAITILENQELAEKLGCVRPDVKFKGAILGCGPYDVMYALGTKTIFDLARGIGNKVLGVDTHDIKNIENYPLKKEISLLEWITPAFPPSFICHTVGDIVCMNQGEPLMEALDKNNVPYVSYYSTKKKDFHCWYLVQNNKSAKLVLNEMIAFMKTLLDGGTIETKKIVY